MQIITMYDLIKVRLTDDGLAAVHKYYEGIMPPQPEELAGQFQFVRFVKVFNKHLRHGQSNTLFESDNFEVVPFPELVQKSLPATASGTDQVTNALIINLNGWVRVKLTKEGLCALCFDIALKNLAYETHFPELLKNPLEPDPEEMAGRFKLIRFMKLFGKDMTLGRPDQLFESPVWEYISC